MPVKEIIIIRRRCLYFLKFAKRWMGYCLEFDGDPFRTHQRSEVRDMKDTK